ncbi:MAG: DUF1028 domain-containing protein [Chloroflexi bacterium]|nr:DUF1028 domain-containing protein [Chloroflexota bacterium]
MTQKTHVPVATFSIVAYDPAAQEWGIAVQSKFLAVGAVVPWAQAGVGAVATQSYANTSYGPKALALMAQGLSAQEALDTIVAEDPGRAQRQVGIVDAQGRAATFTGDECLAWAGGRTGPNYACQGNILVGPETVDAMAETFEASSGALADRLLAALAAGQRAGGDRRGQQSAALLVVKPDGGYGGFNDRYIDLRVDDHPKPIDELARLLDLFRLYFEKADEDALLPITEEVAREIQEKLRDLGYYDGPITGVYDEATARALREYGGVENLEERLREDDRIDPIVLNFLRRQHEQKAGQ